MVELLGSLLAGYAQVSFWWLSFFVNRLLGSVARPCDSVIIL